MVITPILAYLTLLVIKWCLKSNINNFNGNPQGLKHMFIYKFYEFSVNSFEVNILYLPLFTPYYPNLGHLYQADFRGLLICFSMFFQQHMLNLFRVII